MGNKQSSRTSSNHSNSSHRGLPSLCSCCSKQSGSTSPPPPSPRGTLEPSASGENSNHRRHHKKTSQSHNSRTFNIIGRPAEGHGFGMEPGGLGSPHRKDAMANLILSTLDLIRSLVDGEQEPPRAMMMINRQAETDEGWVRVVQTLITVIPGSDPLGPAVINLILDECPIPTREAVQLLYSYLVPFFSLNRDQLPNKTVERNLCIALGCLAEKMAGPSSMWLLTEDVISYLFRNLDNDSQPDASVMLFSLIALEKFALTSENKDTILCELRQKNILGDLERELAGCGNDYVRRQIGFCAQWCLDNVFVLRDHVYAFRSTDVSRINAMLNSQDVSEYLKISPDGLEARCDSASFESVRCTFQVSQGVWYYEVLVVTEGVMQIGWATKDSKFLNYEGYGIGDDENSIAYDGCRQLIWYNAKTTRHQQDRWRPGDILGFLLNFDRKHVVFSLNGRCLPPFTDLFNRASGGFFAAASFMSFQQCRFNFGSEPFRHDPRKYEEDFAVEDFKSFNEAGELSEEDKIIMPRQMKLELLQQTSVHEDACSLCADKLAKVTLLPCQHRGFCMQCALQLEICPMCREKITERQQEL